MSMLAKNIPSRCPDCDRPRGADVGECTCVLTIRVLRKIGAKHAAMMHERDAGGMLSDWHAYDYLMHYDEEERLYFPILARYGAQAVVDLLLSHHVIFRRELAQYGQIMSKDLAKQHSRIEDDMVVKLDLVNKLGA